MTPIPTNGTMPVPVSAQVGRTPVRAPRGLKWDADAIWHLAGLITNPTRARERCGYPERYAQRMLGQNSKIVHRGYAKKAQGELPSLEVYEEANRKAKESGKILVLQHEAEVPKVA